MKKGRMKTAAILLLLCFLTACGAEPAAKEDAVTNIEQSTKRFAGLYGMRYVGMATNRSEAVRLSEKL